MPRPGKEPVPAPAPKPLTEPLTIELTLSGRDLEHFNAYREAVHALNINNWSSKLKTSFTGPSRQLEEFELKKKEACDALANILYEQVGAQLRAPVFR